MHSFPRHNRRLRGWMLLLPLFLTLLFSGCSHPIEVQGNGAVLSGSGDRDCSRETSPCSVLVIKDYVETYTAMPAPGYRFSHWLGCDEELTNQCSFNIMAATVRKFWGKTVPALIAVFEEVGAQPVAAFSARADFAKTPLTVQFDASSSTKGSGDIALHEWDFGDDSTTQGESASHVYPTGGSYIVSLTVTDDADNRHTVSRQVYVANGEDPLFRRQWHLVNNGQAGNGSAGLVGQDLNVQSVWQSCGVFNTCRGEGITIAVVDTGLDMDHPDLKANIVSGSHNYVDGSTDTTPGTEYEVAYHGTAVAGVIAAVSDNDKGGVGVAPRAQLVSYNIVSQEFLATDADDADAATRGDEDISNNSWGFEDNTGSYFPAPKIWRDAIDEGLAKGRGGKGRIYVFAAGNGSPRDLSTQDGRASYRGVLAVGALNDRGEVASYSEPGANLIVGAPGGEFCDTNTIATTDLRGTKGKNPPAENEDGPDLPDLDYTKCFNGTSAAAPQVSGVIALALQANNNLGWRDVKALLASTARKTNPKHPDWHTNGAGYHVNHEYGFGAVDAAAAVAAAKTWKNYPGELNSHHQVAVNLPIPDQDRNGVESTLDVVSGVVFVEAVELTIVATHPYAGDLGVNLINLDTGTISKLVDNLAEEPPPQVADLNYTFYSARHLGENANARWRVQVFDHEEGDVGIWDEFKLSFYGH